MAYDRYDPRDRSRDDRSRWSNDRSSDRSRSAGGDWNSDRGGRGNPDDRGFFDRASDEVASWFGDEEAERRRREDQMRESGSGWHGRSDDDRRDPRGERGSNRNPDSNWDRDRSAGPGRYENWKTNRGAFACGGSSENEYNRGWQRELRGGGGRDQSGFADRGRDYRPMAGDYGRSDDMWERDPYRSTSRAGTRDNSDRSRHEHDPHYSSWRDRHMSDLDRDYDDYRRERQSHFESDFGSWRERRQQKRGLLGQVREQMEVVGNDDQPIGKVDRVAGDRIILTRSDPESGGAHHSISCAEIDRVEGDRVILDCSADDARSRWRDEHRGRALFEREDQGEMRPRMLDRSFEGTYR